MITNFSARRGDVLPSWCESVGLYRFTPNLVCVYVWVCVCGSASSSLCDVLHHQSAGSSSDGWTGPIQQSRCSYAVSTMLMYHSVTRVNSQRRGREGGICLSSYISYLITFEKQINSLLRIRYLCFDCFWGWSCDSFTLKFYKRRTTKLLSKPETIHIFWSGTCWCL